jgi:hypothetical protein
LHHPAGLAGVSHRGCVRPPQQPPTRVATRRGTRHSRDLSGRGAARAKDAQGTPTRRRGG